VRDPGRASALLARNERFSELLARAHASKILTQVPFQTRIHVTKALVSITLFGKQLVNVDSAVCHMIQTHINPDTFASGTPV
jgi:hypothetical protein